MWAGDGLRFLDLSVGSGDEVSAGKKVTVHFDCIYKGIDVVSSRQARLLGGNRTISEVRGGPCLLPLLIMVPAHVNACTRELRS